MYRMIPIRYGIVTHFGRQLNLAPPFRRLLLVSRSLYTQSAEHGKPRSEKLKAYTGSVVALGLISLSIYWALYPSKGTGPSILDERRFQPFAIISKEPVSSTSSVFTLRPGIQPSSDPYAPLWARGIWSVEFKQPQLQIARSYTPLPPTESSVPGDLRFLIRREHHGEVSTYLDRLRVGAIVDIRGPRVEYDIPGDVSEVLFLAGGTGIAPALQVVYTLLEKRARDRMAGEVPNVRILWANRRREDCTGGRRAVKSSRWSWGRSVADDAPSEPPNRIVQELQDLEKRFEGRVKVDYMVDEEGSFIRKSDILKVTSGSLKANEGAKSAKPSMKLLLISGPEGFVDFYTGPREWENGKLGQGRVGGLLAGLGLTDWTVVKL
jgi:cytochrome-b5 reductase